MRIWIQNDFFAWILSFFILIFEYETILCPLHLLLGDTGRRVSIFFLLRVDLRARRWEVEEKRAGKLNWHGN